MSVHFIDRESERSFYQVEFLYRIYTLSRFIDFQNNSFVFVSPSKWSDPYEKAFLEAEYVNQGGSHFHPLKFNDGYNLYAQCWTASKQTEAMWRGFAPNEDGVMIKMATSKLFSLLESISNKGSYDFHIGKVKYEDSVQLYQMKSDPRVWRSIVNHEINRYTLSLLLKKRKAFDFENEFRILAIKRKARNVSYFASFEVNNLLRYVEYLKFDPRMGESIFQFIKDKLLAENSKLKIHKSRLYSNPIKKLTFNGRLPTEINDELIFQ